MKLASAILELTFASSRSKRRIEEENRHSQEKQALADALRRAEQRCRTITEASPDVICTFDRQGRFTSCNRRSWQISGYAESDLVGTSFEPLVEPGDLPGVRQKFAETLAGTPHAYEARVRARDGRTLTLSITTVPLHEDDAIAGVVGFARDVTGERQVEEEHRKLQAQFFQAQKMESVGRLAGGVAHDFNNMLTVILGQAELAMGRLDADSPLRDDLKTIEEAAQRAADLTSRLLGFARRQVIRPKGLDLNVAVEAMLKMLRRLIGENIDLVWLPGADIWPVRVDPGQIDQVLANIVVNARDAIDGAGSVTIRTANIVLDQTYCDQHAGSIAGQYVALVISDTGAGMDGETLSRIFEPFFTTKPAGKGTGLGLATVYGIVKQNNGYLDVTSTPGRGTTVTVYLPRSTAKITRQQPAAGRKALRGRETILLVEDEEAIVNIVKPALEGMGYTVLAALTPSEGLALAERHAVPIDLVVTDVVMPEMSGREFKDRLDALEPGSRCLFMSGYAAAALTDDGVLDEGVNFLQKPFSVKALAERVRAALSD